MRRWLALLLLCWCAWASAQNYHIGDVYTAPDSSRGIVYYLHPDGSGGWVVALTDASTGCAWGDATNVPYLINQSPSYYQQLLNDTAGYANTQIIRSYQNNSTTYAAGKVDFAHGWVLPSPAQLSVLYGQLPLISSAIIAAGGVDLAHDWYWCSAEKNASNAYRVSFVYDYSGYFIPVTKTTSCRVRAVRSFFYANDGSDQEVSYIWSTGDTSAAIIVAPMQTTTYSVIVSTPAGCSDTVEHTIVVNQLDTSEISVTTCGSYTWRNTTYTESGSYTQTFTNAAGCDSVVTLNLTIYNPTHTATTLTQCDSYTWHGITYTSSGTYTYSDTDSHGCNQVDTLHLTIIPSPTLIHTPDTVIIAGTSANLWASGADVLLWTDGSGDNLAIGPSLTVSPETSTLYYLTGQNQGECSATDSVWVYVTGYPDNVDSADCTVFSTGYDWGIDLDWSSTEMVSPLVIPLVGDIDGDGVPEIVCFAPNDSYTYYGSNRVMVFNSLSHQLIHSFYIPERISTVDAAPYGIIKLPNGHVIMVVASLNHTMHAYDLTAMGTTPLWSVNTDYYGPNVSFADFNSDSYPEICIGNKIYDAETGNLLISSTTITNTASSLAHNGDTPLPSPCVANVVGDIRPDLVLGNEIYEVSITNRYGTAGNSIILAKSIVPPTGVSVDGHPQVADFNLDGHLDVFLSKKDSKYASVGCYVWDVYNNTVSNALVIPTSENGKSIPLIADVDNDDTLEIVIQCRASSGNKVKCYKYNAVTASFDFMWDIYVDEDSYSNSMSVFDFNNDGENDLLISDQTTVRIVNGSGHSHLTGNDTIPVYVLTSLSFGECTVMQYPVVADVDADGSAELVVLGRFGSGHTYKAYLNIFKSAGTPWAPARKVWNQYMYNVTNVNEDLTIPQYLFNNAMAFTDPEGVLRRPFNNFLQQATTIDQYGRPFYAVPDVAVNQTASLQANGDSLVLTFFYCNLGDNTLNAPYTITVFDNAYGGEMVCTVTMNESLSVDSCRNGEIRVPIGALCTIQPIDSFVIAVNCAGSGIAQNGAQQPECDTTNNMVTLAFSLHADTTHVTKTACDTFDWYEHVGVTQGGNYTHVFTNATGCDSTVIMHLTVFQSTHNVLDTIVCDSYTWTESDGETYTTSGTYTYGYTNTEGCASVDTLHLTIIPLPVLNHTPDTVIIAGTSATLWAFGADVLCWTNSSGDILSSEPSLTVSPDTSNIYYLTGQNYSAGTSNNLVENGDFEQGNVGFTSDYMYVTGYNSMYYGRYAITTDGLLIWGADHLYGYAETGQFMLVDGSETPNAVVWQQTVSVTPNTYYAFSAQVASTLASYTGDSWALLQFSVNGTQLGPLFHSPDVLNIWQPYYEVWYSGDNTSATLTILNQNNSGIGNDFGLDDIVFAPLAECSVTDSIHVYVTGYPDNVDSADCTFLPEGTEWGVQIGWSSSGIVHNRNIPLVGDLDNDGHPEIVCFAENATTLYAYNITRNNTILVYDGVTKELKNTISLPSYVTTYDAAAYGLVKLPSGKGLIVVACYDLKLRAYDITAPDPNTPCWVSDVNYGSTPGDWAVNLGFADINHDGIPEVYLRDKIYNAVTGVLLATAPTGANSGSSYCHWSHDTHWKLSSPLAADVYGDANLELILGNEIYQIQITNTQGSDGNSFSLAKQITPPGNVTYDGNPQVADFNMDGHLDVFVSVRNTDGIYGTVYGYVWDVYNDTVSNPFVISTSWTGKSIPMIADIDNDNSLEVLIQCGVEGTSDRFRAYKYNSATMSFSLMWSFATDEDSYSNSITSFDFNQDGLLELMICDQSTMRIVNGSGRSHLTHNDTIPVYVMHSFPFVETTIMQYPIIADVDADGNAEIVSVGNHMLNFIESSGEPWAPARKVWNQYMYNVTNVNEDLTIPKFQFNNATAFTDPEGVVRRPFNNFLQQVTTIDQYGRPFYAVPDVAVNQTASLQANGDSLLLTFSYCNLGDNSFNAPYTITVFANAYGGDTVCTVTMNESLSVDSCRNGKIRVHVGALCAAQPVDSLVIAVNCAGSGIAQNGAQQPECDTTNNMVTLAFSLHADTTHVTETACDTYDWYEHVGVTQSGDYAHVFTNAAGCDSTVIMHLTVFQSTHNVLDTTVCESFTWTEGTGETYTVSDTYTHAYTNSDGCSSVDTLHLTILHGTHHVLDTTVCESFIWSEGDGAIYTTSGTYTYDYTNADDCASVDTLHLTILHGTHNVLDTTVCESFTWTEGTGETYTVSNTYTHAYTNADGCSSVDTLHLTVRPLPVAIINGSSHLCEDSSLVLSSDSAASYRWNTGDTTQSIVVHEEGAYTLIVTNEFGCSGDTSIRVSASYNPILDVNIPEMCAGGSYTISVGYQDGHNVQLGHGSTTLSLVDTVFLPDGVPCEPHGCSYRSPLTFSAYGRNEVVESVEDIYYVRLNMEHSWVGDIYINITCPNGQKADIMKYGGSGNSSCNSSIVSASRGWQYGNNAPVSAYFGQAYDMENSSDICNQDAYGNEQGIGWNYCWSNNTSQGYVYAPGDGSLVYRVENVHYGMLDSSNVAAGTQFYHPDQSFSSLIGCPLNGSWYIEVIDGWDGDNGYIFGWELALRNEVLSEEESVFTAATSDGPWITSLSDSLFILDPPAGLTQDTVISYTFHIFDDFGCQYDTTVDVLFYAPSHTVIDTVSCDAIVWNGVQYTESGSYSDTLTSSHGCDSIITLNLTINQCYIEENVDTIVCASALPYTWHGHLFAQEGSWIDTVARNDGFFLITTYQLAVSNPAVTMQNITHITCYGASTGGAGVLVSGGIQPYNCHWVNGAGTTVSSNAQLSNQPAGLYRLYVTDALGCSVMDSVTLTHLNDSMVPGVIASNQSVCAGHQASAFTGTAAMGGAGSVYQWQVSTNGTTWTAAPTPNNTQNYSYPNVVTSPFSLRRAWVSASCGTVYSNVINVTVLQNYSDTITASVCQGYPYQGNGFVISADATSSPGIVTSLIHLQTVNGCDSMVTLLLTVQPSAYTEEQLMICRNELPYTYNDTVFGVGTPQFSTFNFQFSTVEGCDSIVTLHLTVNPVYDIDLNDMVCEGEGYNQYGFVVAPEQTLGVGSLDRIQQLQSQEGCDSVVNLHLTVIDTSVSIVSLTPDFCEEYSAMLTVQTNATSYLWSTGETDQTITVNRPGTYSVTATQGNCSMSAWYLIENCDFNVYLPNAITPGLDDGLNDYFCIHDKYKPLIVQFDIRIYSRWGELVYHSNDKDFKWSGVRNPHTGEVLRNNTYTYLINFTDARGIPYQLTGSITVL